MAAKIGYFLPMGNTFYQPKPGNFFALATLSLGNNIVQSRLLFLFTIISEC